MSAELTKHSALLSVLTQDVTMLRQDVTQLRRGMEGLREHVDARFEAVLEAIRTLGPSSGPAGE
jgi:hypothetical protein